MLKVKHKFALLANAEIDARRRSGNRGIQRLNIATTTVKVKESRKQNHVAAKTITVVVEPG